MSKVVHDFGILSKVRRDGEVDRCDGQNITQQRGQALLSTFPRKTQVTLGLGVYYHPQLPHEVISQLLEGELKSSSSWECGGKEKPSKWRVWVWEPTSTSQNHRCSNRRCVELQHPVLSVLCLSDTFGAAGSYVLGSALWSPSHPGARYACRPSPTGTVQGCLAGC